jgi:xanthine/uracil permease
MKNITPVFLYFISLVCFVLANLVRDKIDFAYGAFLGAGVVFFLYGLYKKFNSK